MPDTPPTYNIFHVVKAVVLTTIIVSLLGYIDCITGEISIDVLYIFCICVVTWFTNTLIGIVCVLEIILAKTTADYYDHIKIGSHLYEWNTFTYLFIYLVVCLLVKKLKKALSA
ncbi:hypothetical protein [Geobacter sp. AOG2]|uniref:hypothetical protein n=1 Tax=Geobacter sp. AOG2 TaxID=1566347 RepID=UPI001CC591BD|nr:hypothetical protein [Geobacter sp. AOG2]GFE60481.1 hypothetical protein AOG2_10690 [Geobacter sp. AOG2]